MKIRIIEFEGSEQEYQAVAHLLGAAATATDAVARPAPLDPVAQAVRALSRIPLPNPARDLLEAVIAAGPKGIAVGALAARLGVASERPVNGHFGALGRRLNGTPGADGTGIRMLLVITRQDNVRHYTLRPELAAPLAAFLAKLPPRKVTP